MDVRGRDAGLDMHVDEAGRRVDRPVQLARRGLVGHVKDHAEHRALGNRQVALDRGDVAEGGEHGTGMETGARFGDGLRGQQQQQGGDQGQRLQHGILAFTGLLAGGSFDDEVLVRLTCDQRPASRRRARQTVTSRATRTHSRMKPVMTMVKVRKVTAMIRGWLKFSPFSRSMMWSRQKKS